MCPREIAPSNPRTIRGAIAHYDGTGWSVTVLDDSQPVLEMYGTTPSTPTAPAVARPRLQSYGEACEPRTLRLVPVGDDGSIGAPSTTSVSIER